MVVEDHIESETESEVSFMCFKDGLTKALYISVGAVAVGVEILGEALDVYAEKGTKVVEQGKTMFKEYCEARKAAAAIDDPAVTVEEDTGDNAPVPGQ